MQTSGIVSRIRMGFLLSLLAATCSCPYLYYQTTGAWSVPLARNWGGAGKEGIVFAFNYSLLVSVVFICSIIGVFLSQRYNLPGMGRFRDAINIVYRYGPHALLFGVAIGWLLHDRTFYVVVPAKTGVELYPRKVLLSIALLLHNSVTKEIVFRFGVLTLAAGLFRGRRHFTAVTLTALFAALFSVRELNFAGWPSLNWHVWSCVAWSFATNAILGLVYIRKGLWATMGLRACIDARFLIYPILSVV